MVETSAVSRQLKLLRQRAGLSIREVAHALGMENGSSYQHYEDRFRRPFLPLELVQKLTPIFAGKGVDAAELYALAGIDGSGGPVRADQPDGALRIEELDVRASAGDNFLGGEDFVACIVERFFEHNKLSTAYKNDARFM